MYCILAFSMTKRTSHPNKQRRPAQSFAFVFRYCFAVLFGLFFILEQTSEIAAAGQKGLLLAGQNVQVSDHKHSFHSSQPAELPSDDSDPDSDSNDPDEAGKRESTEDADDELDKFLSSCSSNASAHFTSLNSRLAELRHKIERRSIISLFVLHHSWKSFLS